MKKKLIVLFIIILSLLATVQFVAANTFPGIVKGSTVDASNKGTVVVTNAEKGATLKLFLAEGDVLSQTVTLTNDETSTTFTDVDPGQYYVTSTTSVDDTEKISSKVDVKPSADNLKLASILGSTQITVTGGIPGATFTLYNENNSAFVERTVTADNDGSQIFPNVPVGKNYRVKQKVKGAESALSTEYVDIYPNKVTLVSTEAGPTNNQGTITVTGSKIGNTLNLYNSENPDKLIDTITLLESDTHTFTRLPAGTYYVIQIQEDLPRKSDETTIGDQQAPKITLNGTDIVRLTYGDEYHDEGVTVVDNYDADPTIHTVGVNNITPEALPGTYTITYSATDKYGNESAKIKRTVIIAPKKIAIVDKHDTHNALEPNRAYGDIIIKDVMAGAILYIYQDNPEDTDDTKDTLSRTITDATEGEMTLKNILVGKDYYIIQKVNNIQSDPSNRVDILDKTNPTLTLNGPSAIELVVGDRYFEQGASAEDNVDDVSELKVVIGGDTVDVNKPGTYTVTYSVSDKAGNKAVPSLSRKITIRPQAVIAIGSTADLGEIGVKNAMPGDVQNLTTLILYKLNSDNSYLEVARKEINDSETTYVFKDKTIGKYYVTQTVNGIESASSNIVEIVDIDRPYITLIGPKKLSFVWNESKLPDYDGKENKFFDPGAKANDYLADQNKDTLLLTSKLTKPNSTELTTCIGETLKCDISIDQPGVYTITYSVKAERGATADDKLRTITIAPPKTAEPVSVTGTSNITVDLDVDYNDIQAVPTTVNLYNAYNQLIDSQEILNKKDETETADFKEVYAGIGYYVTQTVNGIESAPSNPVTVSPFKDADKDKFIGLTSFSFKVIHATGMIDQQSGNITITVPFGTDVTSLIPVYTRIQGTETVIVNDDVQTSESNIQDFTNPVIYTIVSSKNSNITKEYTVTVQVAESKTYSWIDSIKKKITLEKDQTKTFVLTSAEEAKAVEKGMSFITDDLAIHVSPMNIKESNHPALTVKSIEKSNFLQSIDDDLTWKEDLSNIIEVGWDGHSGTFLQPIEVEILDPNDQTFVRLVREDGKLYAIIQPKRYLHSHTVGLATMPGTYALLGEELSAEIKKSGSDYTLSAKYNNVSTDESIYYTIDAKNITFDRSAEDQSTESYLFTGKFSDFKNNWNKYENKPISVPKGDLYAVAEHNQIISTVATLEATPAEQWNVDDVQTVKPSKIWSITFNSKVDYKALFSNSIYVTDDTSGKKFPVSLQLSDDGKTISVAPKQPYTSNHPYTLWIEKSIQSSNSKAFLKEQKKLTFFVK